MSNYFKKIPDFAYVSRLPNAKIGDYIIVKNLFKRGALESDILENIAFHTKYEIKGDDRPDNVAYEVYGNSNLDWLVLTCNNIINVQNEWPMLQNDFDNFLLDKYGSYEKVNSTHHYETQEVKNSNDVVIVPKGLQCESNYSVTYFDSYTGREVTVLSADCTTEVTNYTYEERIENDKRNIYLLKPRYLAIIQDDMEIAMTYQKGSTQYIDPTLKEAENIKLYQ
tara:strand:+ start:83 stop:754 length:672 start_codon:yes stop_codon:yes gene_type:complete